MRRVVKLNGLSYLIVFVVLIVAMSFCLVGIVNAHGGGLDSSGGHNCYVGSCAGTYHRHGGSIKVGGEFNFLWLILVLIVGGYFLDARRERQKREDADKSCKGQVETDQQEELAAAKPEKMQPIAVVSGEVLDPSSDLTEDWLLDEVDLGVLAVEFDNHEMPENEWHEWKRFRSQYADGDTIRMFSSPQDYWDSLCGSAGYALIRNCEIITTLIIEEN